MFGNSVTIVDIIFIPIMQRIDIATDIRGLEIPEELEVSGA